MPKEWRAPTGRGRAIGCARVRPTVRRWSTIGMTSQSKRNPLDENRLGNGVEKSPECSTGSFRCQRGDCGRARKGPGPDAGCSSPGGPIARVKLGLFGSEHLPAAASLSAAPWARLHGRNAGRRGHGAEGWPITLEVQAGRGGTGTIGHHGGENAGENRKRSPKVSGNEGLKFMFSGRAPGFSSWS